MRLKRLFSAASARGSQNYIDTQKKYELARTLLYFGISLSLFIAGYLQTGERANLLTIVAVLGCLPASKSAVSAIMYFRFKSCPPKTAEEIEKHSQGLHCLYDMVFTSYKKNYCVAHLAVRAGNVCGCAEDERFDENEFYRHIGDILTMDGHKNVTVKIFKNLAKYTERLDQLRSLETDEARDLAVINTLKSVAL